MISFRHFSFSAFFFFHLFTILKICDIIYITQIYISEREMTSMLDIHAILLPKDTCPTTQIVQDMEDLRFSSNNTFVLLSKATYSALEQNLSFQMGSRNYTRYGKVSGTKLSVAVAYEPCANLFSLIWIYDGTSYLYNLENIGKDSASVCLYYLKEEEDALEEMKKLIAQYRRI